MRAVDAYCRALDSLLAQGAVKEQLALESSLRSLLALRAADWQQPAAIASPDASATAFMAAADAAADALACKLTLSDPLAPAAALPSALFPAATAAGPYSIQLPAAPQRSPPPVPALMPQPNQAAPVHAAPCTLLPDEWDYLAPDGAGVFGPYSMEQLQYWVAQGHMEEGVQVKPHSAGSGWWGLHTAAHCLATGQPLPLAAPPPHLPPAQAAMPLLLQSVPAGVQHDSAPLPGPRPGLPPANLNGGSGAWVGHTTPVQQLASFQQESSPSLGGALPSAPSAMVQPPAFAPPAQPSPRQLPSATAPPPSQPTFQLPAAAFSPVQKSQPQEEPDAASWMQAPTRKLVAGRPAPTAPMAVPKPASRQGQQAGGAALTLTRAHSNSASSSAGSSPAGSAGRAGGWGSAGGGGARKSKGVGYEDDKHWLVRDARGRTTGPFSGPELLDMVMTDTLAESTQVKKNDWKAYKPLEQVEDVILEMYSKKPQAGTKSQPPSATAAGGHRRLSESENLGSGHRKVYAHTSPNNAGWQLRAVRAVVAEAAGQSPRRSTAGQGRSRQPGAADAAWEEGAQGGRSAQLALPAHRQLAHAEPAVGTPAAAPPSAHWENVVLEWPVLGTPAPAGIAPDAPAAATPPSPLYTPGLAGMADCLLAGFTPDPPGSCASGSVQPGHSSWESPAAWDSPAGAADGGSLTDGPWGPAMAGGPQAQAEPKAAFASWAAADAARREPAGSGSTAASSQRQ